MVEPTGEERALNLIREAGVVRPRDLREQGVPRQYLQRLHSRGLVVREGRGLYRAADVEPTAHHSLAEAAKRVPRGVVCLLSALEFHGIGTQAPFEVWMAVERSAWKPGDADLPLRIFRFSGEAFSSFVETHEVDRVPVRIYSVAKTVADCFKLRNRVGLDVALEALRDAWERRRVTMDELTEAARVCRVANVMRPYLEFLR